MKIVYLCFLANIMMSCNHGDSQLDKNKKIEVKIDVAEMNLKDSSMEIEMDTTNLINEEDTISSEITGLNEANILDLLVSNSVVSGSDLSIKKGTYKLDSPLKLIAKKNVMIDGNGSNFIMQDGANDVVFLENCKNITLMNFKATHIEPKGPLGCTGNVIHIEGCEDVLIENCDLNGSGIVGIAAYRTQNLVVNNNYIHENSQYGIIYQGPGIEINGNVFEDNTQGHIYFSYLDTSWPPKEKINTNQNKEGLKMSGNSFK